MTRSLKTTRRKYAAAFTLLEAMISLGIMSVLMLASMDIFVNSLRMTSRSSAEVFASQDAAVAMRRVQDQVRESLWLALPDSNDAYDTSGHLYFNDELASFPSLSNYLLSPQQYFMATDSTKTYTADTALFLATPTVDNAPTFNTSSQNGVTPSNLTIPYSLYDRTQPNNGGILYYRADANGTPDPVAGTCFWELSSGANPTTNKALISSVDTKTWNAVQFERPVLGGNTPAQYEVEVKITSGYYSAINQQQTNESTGGGSTTQLVGRCVSMRDHETGTGTGVVGTHYPNPLGANAATVENGNKYQSTTDAPGQAG
jgi:type II secretory pathway pseudopilin PulG